MNFKNLSMKSVVTRNFNIINLSPISYEESLQLELNRTIKKNTNGFSCLLKATIFKTPEAEAEKKSFSIQQIIEGTFEYPMDTSDTDKEGAYEQAVDIMYPYLRAQIAAVTGAIGIDQVLIPDYITKE